MYFYGFYTKYAVQHGQILGKKHISVIFAYNLHIFLHVSQLL